MSDVKRLLDAASPLPWIRSWGQLTVRAGLANDDDVLAHLVPSISHPGTLRAQANIDLAVHAVNHLPAYEAVVDALVAYVQAQGRMLDRWAEGDDAVKRELWAALHACEEPAREALARLRDEVPA